VSLATAIPGGQAVDQYTWTQAAVTRVATLNSGDRMGAPGRVATLSHGADR
jgi:hypothetical protein